MCFVYIVQSIKTKKYFIGSSRNLERILSEHNSGKTKSLKNRRSVKLVFSQKFNTTQEARHVERKLKSYKNRNIIEKIFGIKELPIRAYSSVVERLHGMEEVGVRFSLGPQIISISYFYCAQSQNESIIYK